MRLCWTHKPSVSRAFPSRECFNLVLVLNTQAFLSRECCLAGTCGKHTSFSCQRVSSGAWKMRKLSRLESADRAGACGDTQACLLGMLQAGVCQQIRRCLSETRAQLGGHGRFVDGNGGRSASSIGQ